MYETAAFLHWYEESSLGESLVMKEETKQLSWFDYCEKYLSVDFLIQCGDEDGQTYLFSVNLSFKLTLFS